MHPLLCQIGGAWVTTYSALVWSGYILGVLWLRTQLKHVNGTPGLFWGLTATLISAGLLGGKLGFYLIEWRFFMEDPRGSLATWTNGWVFWPGVLSAMAAGLAFKAWYNATHRPRTYLHIADYVITALPLGHFLGRLGCFMEGCCHGRPTGLPWGVVFSKDSFSVEPPLVGLALHPTQLYEAAGQLLLFFFFGYWVLPRIRAAKFRYGTAFFGYTACYSLLRFFNEFLRGDDRGVILSSALSPSQWLSLAAGLAAAAALWHRGVVERHPKTRSYYADGKP